MTTKLFCHTSSVSVYFAILMMGGSAFGIFMSTFHKSYKHIFQCITVLD
jgi:hypothetical protein